MWFLPSCEGRKVSVFSTAKKRVIHVLFNSGCTVREDKAAFHNDFILKLLNNTIYENN